MSAHEKSIGRRGFLKSAGAVGASVSLASSAFAAAQSRTSGRVLGANDRINVGVIGCGGGGTYVGREVAQTGGAAHPRNSQGCDGYQKRGGEKGQIHKGPRAIG